MKIWAFLTLLAVMVIAATAAQAERIVVEPTAIVAVSPDGMGGVALSARVASLGKSGETPRRGLWVDVAALSRNLSEWTGAVGLSTEISAGRATRGGISYDLRESRALLVITRSFETAF